MNLTYTFKKALLRSSIFMQKQMFRYSYGASVAASGLPSAPIAGFGMIAPAIG